MRQRSLTCPGAAGWSNGNFSASEVMGREIESRRGIRRVVAFIEKRSPTFLEEVFPSERGQFRR
jgi:hypothetical protein